MRLITGQVYEVELRYKALHSNKVPGSRSGSYALPALCIRVPMLLDAVLGDKCLMRQYQQDVSTGALLLKERTTTRRVKKSQVIGLWANRHTSPQLEGSFT